MQQDEKPLEGQIQYDAASEISEEPSKYISEKSSKDLNANFDISRFSHN